MKSTSVYSWRLPVQALVFVATLLACLSATAAPANDMCSGRITIPADGPFPYHNNVNTFGATTTGDPVELPSCQPSVAGSVWFEFRPAVTAFYTLSTCSEETTLEDTVMAIYTSDSGCVASGFHELEMSADGLVNGCNDDACGPGQGLLAAITTRLDADTAYYIVVWRYNDGIVPSLENSRLQLIINRTFPPENDTCLTRMFLPLNVRVDGSTIGATNQYQYPMSKAQGRDVVYSFTAPEATNYSFVVQNYRGEDLVVYAATTCPTGSGINTIASPLAVADRNPVSTAEEIFCLPLAANQEISIYVDDHDGSSIGSSFSIQATKCVIESEPNNTNYWANPLACGIEGRIFPARDKDFFALGTFPAGYRAFAMVDAAAAKLPEMIIRVVTSDGETLEYDDSDNDIAFGDLSSNVAGTPLTNKPTYLRLEMSGTLTNEPYRIYAVVQPPYSAATLETEPNNTTAAASQDTANYFRGSISAAGDVDMFGFFADSGDLIFVSLDADPLRNTTPFNARLELLDEAGNVLISVDDLNSDSQSGTNLAGTVPFSPGEALVYRSNDEALYFVRVSATPRPGEPQIGDYLLSVTRNCYVGGGQNTAPTISSLLANSPINEGGTLTVQGTIVDRDAGEAFQVSVDWGDGSPVTVTNLAAGINSFEVSHFVADDNPTGTSSDNKQVTVTVTDRVGGVGTSSTPVTINNVAPMLANTAVTSPVWPHETATVSGEFQDASALDTFVVTVNWGDGSMPSVGNFAAGPGVFSFQHQYTTGNSNFPVTVTVRDDDTGTATFNTAIAVRPPPSRANLGSITRMEDGRVLLQLQGSPNATYRIEISTDLQTWSTIATRTADSIGMFSFEDNTLPRPAKRFYRAVWP